MAKLIGKISDFSGGIADSIKQGIPNSCAFSRSIDYRPDSRRIKLLPKTSKESGNLVTDLPMWAERINSTNETIIYGDSGNLYKRTDAGVYSLEHTAAASSGNGLAYFGEDGYMYYTQDKTIGRYGRVDSSPQWYDDFLGSEGGEPTNSYSLDLESGSSQYATAADSASLSITGPLTLEAYVKPESLPAINNTMALVGKWDASGTTRSYLFDIKGVSNFFQDGSDGALTISSDTTEAPIDSACSGTSGSYSLTATNVSFAVGQALMIHQTQGTGAGNVQYTSIASYTAGTITTTDPLNFSYSTGAQVRVMKRYTNVTINTGVTYTAKAWNGTVGGILAFYSNGTTTVTGSITASGKGFRGGAGRGPGNALDGYQGEGSLGTGSISTSSNGSGGGGGNYVINQAAYGGGGGNGTVGSVGPSDNNGVQGLGGLTTGTTDLTTITFGGGGGSGATGNDSASYSLAGGKGGGIIVVFASSLVVTGTISANGSVGGDGPYQSKPAGGGAGGSILLKVGTATLGSSLVTANGGDGGYTGAYSVYGASGGEGRIHSSYATSVTGTTSPTIDSSLDSSINLNDGHQLRLGISSDGTTEDFMTCDLVGNISTGIWSRFSVTWDNVTSLARFYKDGVILNQKYGTATSIHNNASLLYIGANKGASAVESFFDGKIDSIRIWSTERLAADILQTTDQILYGTESYLNAYYKFENAYTDTTSNANNLTAVNTPVFVLNDVPFSGVTTRQDQDLSLTATGQTYTTPTSISESATARQTFVPTKDPQKSIRVYISSKGTGDWTVTVHDPLNRVIGTSTVANASLSTGFYEFIFTSWRPVVGATYHFHITSTVADGTLRTGTTADLETADFATFYQFLVEDDYHPMGQITNVLAVGNERYLATWDGLTYNPMRLTLPTGYRIRCLSFWREFLVIGTWRGTSVTSYDEGKVFFWDGISDTYNFFIDVPEGAINACLGTKGRLYLWAGYSSDLLLYMGGDSAQKIKRIPNVDISTYVEVLPGAITMWRTLIHTGIVGNSDSTTISRGVYTWGSLNRNYDDTLNYDYPLSTGDTSDCRIGMVKSIGRKLLIGYQCGLAYGVDVVDPTGSSYSTGTYEALVDDGGNMGSQKLPLIVRTDFEPLTTGQSVTIKYQVDRSGMWKSVTESTVGIDNVRIPCRDRYREIQIAADLSTTSGISPQIYSLSIEAEGLQQERQA